MRVPAVALAVLFASAHPASAQGEPTRGTARIVGGGALLASDEGSTAEGVGPTIAASIGGRYRPRVVVEAEVVWIGNVSSEYLTGGHSTYDIQYQHNQFGLVVRVSPSTPFKSTEFDWLLGFAVTYARYDSNLYRPTTGFWLGVAPNGGVEFTRWKSRVGFAVGGRAIFAFRPDAFATMLTATAGLRTRF